MGWLVGPVVFVALAVPSWGFGQTSVSGWRRVRGNGPAIVEAIAQANEQSPTFNQLVAAITATDGIVYVHYGGCQRNGRSCLVLAVTQAGPNGILHIRIDRRSTLGSGTQGAPCQEVTPTSAYTDPPEARHATTRQSSHGIFVLA